MQPSFRIGSCKVTRFVPIHLNGTMHGMCSRPWPTAARQGSVLSGAIGRSSTANAAFRLSAVIRRQDAE
jgi:hypothetical protein